MLIPVRRRVPTNHSCLFECFNVLCQGLKEWEPASSSGLRALCANVVMTDPDPETKALMLGMAVDKYAVWITNEMNWGGEHEIVALADFFGVEVGVVSCESFSTLVYGQTEDAERPRIYILYTGQHYDPIVSVEEGSAEIDTGAADVLALPSDVTHSLGHPEYTTAAIDIAKSHVAEFEKRMSERRVKRIKCLGCNAVLDDNQAFQDHCMTVEHDDEFAYDCVEVEVVEAGDDEAPEGRLDLASDATLTFYNLPNVWFSPHYASPITLDSVTFPSTAHHFQWCRYRDNNPEFASMVLGVPNADELAPLVNSREYSEQHSDWDTVKGEALLVGIRAKVEQHPEIAAQLRATADKTLVLIDTDPWAGVQAGDGIPTGRNAVGEAWMTVRGDLLP
eukprot:m.213296 g.213296  ORF g.213296 m.213296 type:complete len:392 (+) comp25555_c0_seq1:104-1279(+)